jgi:hypothetical protein
MGALTFDRMAYHLPTTFLPLLLSTPLIHTPTSSHLPLPKVREIRRHLLERESSRDKDELGYAALVRSHSKEWTGAAAAPAGKPGRKLVRKASKAEKAAAAKKELADLPPKLSTGQIKLQVRGQGGDAGSNFRSAFLHQTPPGLFFLGRPWRAVTPHNEA